MHARITPRLWGLLWVTAALLLGCARERQAGPSRPGQIALKPCTLSSPSSPQYLRARCGTFEVPEDWDQPKGRKIKLFLAVVRARQKEHKPDPLFFFTGGPGQAATESYPQMAGGFARINQTRDVVLIDQRGTGRSNRLTCDRSAFKDMTTEPTPAQVVTWLKQCVASHKSGLQHYTTTSSIRDVNAVRQALGYGKINLYGISYGTRMAQSYMRRYAKHVRSVMLDGVIPQDLILGYDTSVHAPARVKKWLLLRCRADRHCHKAFPKLAESLAAVEQLIKDKEPILEFTHPRTHKRFKARVSWSSWGLGFRLFGYSSGMVSLLPLLLDQSHKQKDIRPLLKWLLAQLEEVHKMIGSLENSVLCSEDWPFMAKQKQMQKSSTGYGGKRLEMFPILCKHWPHKPVHPDFKKPVVSSIPTLLMSGQYDPVTPPAFATRAAKQLSHSLHIVVPGEGHGAIGHGCAPRLASQFIKQASTKKLKVGCLKKHKPVGFFIDFAGPRIAP